MHSHDKKPSQTRDQPHRNRSHTKPWDREKSLGFISHKQQCYICIARKKTELTRTLCGGGGNHRFTIFAGATPAAEDTYTSHNHLAHSSEKEAEIALHCPVAQCENSRLTLELCIYTRNSIIQLLNYSQVSIDLCLTK